MTYKRSNALREQDRKRFARYVLDCLGDLEKSTIEIADEKLTKTEKQKRGKALSAAKYLIERFEKKQKLNLTQYKPFEKKILLLIAVYCTSKKTEKKPIAKRVKPKIKKND